MNKFILATVMLVVSLMLVGCGKDASVNDAAKNDTTKVVVKSNTDGNASSKKEVKDQKEQKEFDPEEFHDEEIDDLLMMFEGLVEG